MEKSKILLKQTHYCCVKELSQLLKIASADNILLNNPEQGTDLILSYTI